MIALLATNLGIVLGAMTLLWLVSLAMRDASIIDPAWGLGFVLLAWVSLVRVEAPDQRIWLLAILTTIWGARLAGYLFWRNFGQGEDRRYVEMRQHHGARFAWVSLFTVFWLQAVILWFVALPLQFAAFYADGDPVAWSGLDLLGVALWLLGLAFESIGDVQLARFKADPANAGQVLDRGLWRYTRHPNYFGDFCVWWGLYFIAASGGAGLTVLSPLLMSLLLMRVSGVTLLEKTITERRPAYRDYIARTNAFFPGPPRLRNG